MISITNFKDILASKAGGKPVSKIANFYSMCFEAMLEIKSNVDLPSAIRTVTLPNPIYTDVDNYVLPNDLTMNGIINLRPIDNTDLTYYDMTAVGQRQFKVEEKFRNNPAGSGTPIYAPRFNNGIQSLYLLAKTTSPLLINSCESLTVGGTWAIFGTAQDLAVDSFVKAVGSSSIGFSCGIGSSNGVQVTSIPVVDITPENDLLLYVYLPSIANVTGLRYSVGQNASNYYSANVTSDFFGNALAAGWNLIRVPKSALTIGAGAPTYLITFARLEILGTFAALTTGFRVDNLVAQVGALYEMDYYSDLQFLDVSGNRIAKPTTDNDNILLSGDEINLYLAEFISIMVTDLKQAGAGVDQNKYGNRIFSRKGIAFDRYDEFKIKFPSQRKLITTQYGNRPRFDRTDGWGN